MRKITVLLADDHTMVREGFRKMLELEHDLEVVGEAQDGRQAVALVGELHPAVVLMDVAMPMLNGLEATRQVVKSFPDTKVLMLSAHSDHLYVQHAAEAGAVGFLLKQNSAHEVCRAIREVQDGKSHFAPTVPTHGHGRSPPSPSRVSLLHKQPAPLTPREREVVQLIAEGKSNKQIATTLCIGLKTTEKHREHLMRKLNIHDTAAVTRYAISAGIIENSVQLTVA